MTIEAEMMIGGKNEWRKVYCPMSSEDACGEWCAWYGEETVGGALGIPVRVVVTCQGRSIGEISGVELQEASPEDVQEKSCENIDVREEASMSEMFDVTRHRVIRALRIADMGSSWHRVESYAAALVAELDDLKAKQEESRRLIEEISVRVDQARKERDEALKKIDLEYAEVMGVIGVYDRG
jgi:hypothetical protein